MTTTHARIFISGNSQAIRVPKSLAYPPHGHDLVVRRDGDRLIFEPAPVQDFSAAF